MQDYTAIKDVVAICRDAEQGFRGAANAVKSPLLKDLFEQYSIQRGEFAQQLREAARALGMEVGDSSGLGGMLHAGWMGLKAALSRNDEHQILVEAQRGEEYSLRAYREALGLNLTEGIRTVLDSQLAEVQLAHDRIQALCSSTVKHAVHQEGEEPVAEEPAGGAPPPPM